MSERVRDASDLGSMLCELHNVEDVLEQKGPDEDGGEHHNIAAQSHHFLDESGFCVLDIPTVV